MEPLSVFVRLCLTQKGHHKLYQKIVSKMCSIQFELNCAFGKVCSLMSWSEQWWDGAHPQRALIIIVSITVGCSFFCDNWTISKALELIATIFEVVLSDLKLSIDGYCWWEWWYGCNNKLTEEEIRFTQWEHWRWKIMQVSNLEGIDFWGEMIWGEGGWLVLMWCLALQCTRKQNAHHPLTSFRLWFLASHHTTHVTI